MTLALTQDAALVNSFANDPAISEGAGFGGQVVDCGPRMLDGDLSFLTDGVAAMMALHHNGDPSRLQKHNLFKAGCRGGDAVRMGRAMFAWVGENMGARVVWAQTPIANRKARWFNRQLGMTSRGISASDLLGDVEIFEKELDQCH
jgi:hypothetical protein